MIYFFTFGGKGSFKGLNNQPIDDKVSSSKVLEYNSIIATWRDKKCFNNSPSFTGFVKIPTLFQDIWHLPSSKYCLYSCHKIIASRNKNMCSILKFFLFAIVNILGQKFKVRSSEEAKRQNAIQHFGNEKLYQEYHDRDYGKSKTMLYAVQN